MASGLKCLSPYLAVKGAADAIDFYRQAFGAVERFRLIDPLDGRVGHAELMFGDTVVMLSDEYPDFGALAPDTIGGSPVKLHLEVDDAEAATARAVSFGAVVLRPVRDEFHGSRTAMVSCPFGYSWFLDQRIEDVSTDEMQARWAASTETGA
ncbi:VOC family protein [Brevundimonas sp. R86498]|uniref:VOC family protein n=1 Tax=Brevundimonas sp. R86498 TaxID=3093845 RepID=UPI0037C8E7C9